MLPILFLLLLFNLGCFSSSSHHHRRRKKPTTAVLNYLKSLFSAGAGGHIPPPPPSIPSPSSSTRSLRLNPPLLAPLDTSTNITTNTNTTRTRQAAALVAPADIHPCTVCGEILQSPTSLHHHQSTKHGVSDLADGENIIRLIFLAGWPENPAGAANIRRILKIHNTPRALARFEDHRRRVTAAAGGAVAGAGGRCAADGNELLRFHCTTFLCGLDAAVCSHQFCGACGIIRCGFSDKLDGIPTLPTGWKAHAAVPADVEEEFGFLRVRRAVLVCRVIAGRVGTLSDARPDRGPEFDSLVGPGGDELFVFSPRAVLPCFVIVYTV